MLFESKIWAGYITDHLLSPCLGFYVWCFQSGFDVGGGKCVVSVYRFSLVGIGIFKGSLICQSTTFVEVLDLQFDSAKWAGSLKNEVTKEEVLGKVLSNAVLKKLLG